MYPLIIIPRKVFKSFLGLKDIKHSNINIYTDTVEFLKNKQ